MLAYRGPSQSAQGLCEPLRGMLHHAVVSEKHCFSSRAPVDVRLSPSLSRAFSTPLPLSPVPPQGPCGPSVLAGPGGGGGGREAALAHGVGRSVGQGREVHSGVVQGGGVLSKGSRSVVLGSERHHRGDSGVHATDSIHADLGLEVPGGLEFQTLVGTFWNTWTPVECLLEPCSEPGRMSQSILRILQNILKMLHYM